MKRQAPAIAEVPAQLPHWYRRYVGECPVCGKDASYRERVYGEPPADPAERVVQLSYQDTYDHCLEYEACR